MRDFSNLETRQQFLQNTINRNLLIKRLVEIKSDAETKAMKLESELLEELISIISTNDNDSLIRFKKKMLLRKMLRA
jgi:hypothetical protein